METAKLKLELIRRISDIEDAQIIQELKKFLDLELGQVPFSLSSAQRNRIAEARAEYKAGDVFTNEDVETEMQEWLNGQ